MLKFVRNSNFLSAVEDNNLEATKQFLLEGADINATDSNFFSALHKAVINNNIEMIYFLISNGINVNMHNMVGDTPLHMAVYKSDIKTLDILEIFYKNNANINIKNVRGDTLLHVACYKNTDYTEGIIFYLILYVVDINATNKLGYTALHNAVNIRNIHAVIVLVVNGAIVPKNIIPEVATMLLLNGKVELVETVLFSSDEKVYTQLRKSMSKEIWKAFDEQTLLGRLHEIYYYLNYYKELFSGDLSIINERIYKDNELLDIKDVDCEKLFSILDIVSLYEEEFGEKYRSIFDDVRNIRLWAGVICKDYFMNQALVNFNSLRIDQ